MYFGALTITYYVSSPGRTCFISGYSTGTLPNRDFSTLSKEAEAQAFCACLTAAHFSLAQTHWCVWWMHCFLADIVALWCFDWRHTL